MLTDAATLPTIVPNWSAPAHIHACCTTRAGGVSTGPYASLNLALHVGDEPAAVAHNRARLRTALRLPAEPCWLDQTHGNLVVAADTYPTPPQADGSFTTRRGQVLGILTADCFPILLSDRQGTLVLALHAGWRGLLSGIIRKALDGFDIPRGHWLAWIGPGIGPGAYTVGPELRERFCAEAPALAEFFTRGTDSLRADLAGIAEWQLRAAGVAEVSRCGGCTASDASSFYSYRRAGVTGRFATLIWMD